MTSVFWGYFAACVLLGNIVIVGGAYLLLANLWCRVAAYITDRKNGVEL